MRADSARRSRIIGEPGEEIEVRDGGGQEINGRDPVAVAVEGEGIGNGFIK